MLLRSRGTLELPSQAPQGADSGATRSIFTKSFLVAVTNPKGYLFFSAFLPQFIDPALPQTPQYAMNVIDSKKLRRGVRAENRTRFSSFRSRISP